MLITKREEVTRQGFCKILWRKLCPIIKIYSLKWVGWGWPLIWVWLGSGGGGRLFEAGRLLTFPAFRMGAYSGWALIRGWARIRINTVFIKGCCGYSSSVKQCLSSVNHEQFPMQMTHTELHAQQVPANPRRRRFYIETAPENAD